MHFFNSVYFPAMPAAALWFRFKPISCASVMYTNFPFLFVWSCAKFVRLIHTHTRTHSHTLGCEFQHFLMTFKWELRLISPACPKIEISQDRRTITASCFPGVSCQDGWRVSALFTQFPFKCSAPQRSHVHLQHFTAFTTSSSVKCQYGADYAMELKFIGLISREDEK